ncbi:MAG: hypothetical protein FRX48_09200 [Lasallia pustulata]|uniref:Uncharacterized protein n=1 Tax=Lasallia pustulata TaxID=136370 RepID=A0A5M8PE05_9LECA|nr:MAG: hypothetical protein FRX48_09200 [Lasallia pustulata]
MPEKAGSKKQPSSPHRRAGRLPLAEPSAREAISFTARSAPSFDGLAGSAIERVKLITAISGPLADPDAEDARPEKLQPAAHSFVRPLERAGARRVQRPRRHRRSKHPAGTRLFGFRVVFRAFGHPQEVPQRETTRLHPRSLTGG